jgi:hypothetical protein
MPSLRLRRLAINRQTAKAAIERWMTAFCRKSVLGQSCISRDANCRGRNRRNAIDETAGRPI